MTSHLPTNHSNIAQQNKPNCKMSSLVFRRFSQFSRHQQFRNVTRICVRHSSTGSNARKQHFNTILATVVPLSAVSGLIIHKILSSKNSSCESKLKSNKPSADTIASRAKELQHKTLHEAITESRDLAQRIKVNVQTMEQEKLACCCPKQT